MEEFYSRRCPDAGVGAGFGRGMIGWLLGGGGVLPSNHFVPKNNPGFGTQMGGSLLPRFVVSGGWEVTLGPLLLRQLNGRCLIAEILGLTSD